MHLHRHSLPHAFRSAFSSLDRRLSAGSFIRLCKENTLRGQTEHSLYDHAFVYAHTCIHPFLSDEGRYCRSARNLFLVRALGADRSDPQAKDPLLLILEHPKTFAYLNQKNIPKGADQGTPTIKQVLPPEKEKRGADDSVILLTEYHAN